MFKVNNSKHQNDVNDFALVFLFLTYFTPFSVSLVNFEQVNVSWVIAVLEKYNFGHDFTDWIKILLNPLMHNVPKWSDTL